MLKLILPLTTYDTNHDDRAEPLALLVHPQQPLSYLERLIQSELPVIKDKKSGKERIPAVYFLAEDSMQDSLEPKAEAEEKGKDVKEDEEAQEKTEEQTDDLDKESTDSTYIDGKSVKTGKLSSEKSTTTSSTESADLRRGGPGEGGVESYSGLGHEASQDEDAPKPEDRKFVRWSSSTEIGDFIRDAARGQEFAVEIEGAPAEVRIGVPSFNDRTYYLRARLRSKSKAIASMADVKRECDDIAHQSAQRIAVGGFGLLVGWWYLVYRLTFETDLGWDVMEPVTYLVGLSTLIGGYVWFLWHNREVSYRSAMNITINSRQSKLYALKGFDVQKWEALIEEANMLRREIKNVASEYDVDWDEEQEIKDMDLGEKEARKVKRALKHERDRKKNGEGKEKKTDKDDDDEVDN